MTDVADGSISFTLEISRNVSLRAHSIYELSRVRDFRTLTQRGLKMDEMLFGVGGIP